MTEAEQILELKYGNHTAFEWLYKKYWSQVYNFTRLYITSIEESKEIVQEVFIKIWESRKTIDEKKNFKGLLFITTRNLVFDIKRENLNQEYYKTSVINAFNDNDVKNYYNVEEEIYASELSEYIQQLIDNLPDKQKEIFRLSRVEHLSNKEIATKMNLSVKSIEGYITKTLKLLKENIVLFTIFCSFFE